MSEKVVYTAYFVVNPKELLAQLPPAISGEGVKVHAHHVTKAFKPRDGLKGVTPGLGRTLLITGQVLAEGVHAATVESPDGEPFTNNEHPHITIATAEGVPPVQSNEVIARAKRDHTIIPIHPPIKLDVVEGYFDGTTIHLK